MSFTNETVSGRQGASISRAGDFARRLSEYGIQDKHLQRLYEDPELMRMAAEHITFLAENPAYHAHSSND